MGLSLAGPSGVGPMLRALRFFACVDPVTDASGFPYRPSFDGGLGRCTRAVSCGRQHCPFRFAGWHARVPCVCACACFLGRVGQAGLPGAFWCTSPFPLALPVALLVCSAPSGLGLPCLCCFWVFFPLLCAPLVSGVPCFPAPDALGLGVLWSLPHPCFVFFPPSPLRFFFLLFLLWVFFLFSSFFSCCAGCAVPCWSVVGYLACWCVLLWALCFSGGRQALALCCLVLPACASPFCVVACCVACARWRRADSVAPLPAAFGGCRVVLPARPLGRLARGFFFASGLCWFCPPPPPLGGWLRCPVLWFVVRRVVWCCGLWCVSCCVRYCVPKALLPKGKRPGCLPTGKGKRAGLCVLCARRA